MNARLDVIKTCKLFIGGAFPRTESGRSRPVLDGKDRVIAHVCVASRKDMRNAVEAARKAAPGWMDATAYLLASPKNREELLASIDELTRTGGTERELIE